MSLANFFSRQNLGSHWSVSAAAAALLIRYIYPIEVKGTVYRHLPSSAPKQ